MPPTTPLPLILAHVRAGALRQAWRLFRGAGLEAEDGDAAVLAVKGRLLKEEAAGAEGAGRRLLLARAADAYAAAGAISGQSYHLINAATLRLLSGDPGAAADGARRVLEHLSAHPDEAETPYWLGATCAEALLLLGRRDEARAALAAAVAQAPRAWEDHAPTLRQFRQICAVQGADAGWLDLLRPPRALHFAGHMSLSADAAELRRRVAEALAEEAVGFGFGALAAGADVIVAEELVARGAELHLILPAAPAVFRASVADHHGDWGRRYDALLEAATTIRSTGEGDAPPDVLTVQLAAELAMGEAALAAQRLQGEAVQLLILDLDERGGDPGGSGWARGLWAGSGRRQTVIQAPREGRAAQPVGRAAPNARLLTLLTLAVEPADLGRLASVLAAAPAPAVAPSWSGHAIQLAYAEPGPAAVAALAVVAALDVGVRIGGAYGVATATPFPGLEAPLISGAPAMAAAALADYAPPGAIQVTEPFAAALAAASAALRLGLICDLELPGAAESTPVYALGT